MLPQYRPQQPGNLTASSVPDHSQVHSDSGHLGRMDFYRPGRAKPLVTDMPRIGATALALSYQVTEADLATPGDWTCPVMNATDTDLTFETEISYPTRTPLIHKTATFDIGLLQLILAEAVADSGLNIHIQSSGDDSDEESLISWSAAVAETLTGPWHGKTELAFFVADKRFDKNDQEWLGIDWTLPVKITWLVLRIEGVDSDPSAPVSASLSGDQVPVLEAGLAFKQDTARLVAIDSDVNLDELLLFDVHSISVGVTLSFDGTLRGTAEATVFLRIGGLQGGVDVSGLVTEQLQGAVGEQLSRLDRKTVCGYIDAFFVTLMRLGADARILGYQSDGQTLTVSYAVPAVPPTTGVTPPTPTKVV